MLAQRSDDLTTQTRGQSATVGCRASVRRIVLFSVPLLVLFIRATIPASGQSVPFDRAAWTNYTFMNNVMGLAIVDETLWVATTGGLVRLRADSPDRQTRFTNVEGLGDIDLRFVAVDSAGGIWAGGTRGHLSRRWSDRLWDVYDFEIDGARIPLNAAAPGPGAFLWVASDIGVHKFDMNRNGGEIKESYTRLGAWPASNPVRDVLVADDFVWVVGPAGAARGDVQDQFLLAPDHWKTWTGVTSFNALAFFQGHVFAGGDAGLFACTDTLTVPGDTLWVKIGLDQIEIRDLFATSDTLWISTSAGLALYANGHAVNPPALGSPSVSLTSVARTSDGTVWAGRLRDGLLQLRQSAWTTMRFEGPLDGDFADLAIGLDGKVWCVHPNQGADYLDSNRWTPLQFFQTGASSPATSVAVAPSGEIWLAGWGVGAYKINPSDAQHDWVHYDTANSSLMWVKDPGGRNNYIVIRDVAIDSLGRVWFANAAADSGRVLAYYDPAGGGCWGSFGAVDGLSADDPAVLLVLNQEVLAGFGSSGLVDITFNSALCRDSQAVSPPIHLTSKTTDNGLPSNNVRAILIDHADSLWVGTNVGLVRWAADIRLFLSVPLPADAGLSINTLAVDALNTVWVGTDRGMVMLPPGGASVFFSPENSGLAGYDVQKIVVNEQTGEVWIGTGAGLSRLAAGVPIAKSLKDITAYPNPFELETGIDKRVRFNAPFGSRIYIFTAAGEPVTDFDASLGWNGGNTAGNPVASGVYPFVVRGSNGETGQGKIAVIRRR